MGNEKKKRRRRREVVQLSIVIGVVVLFVWFSFYLTIRKDRMQRALLPVEASEVCMLDDLFTPTGNYRTEIKHKAFYCCQKDCAEHFNEKGFATFAGDPISKATVDKSIAV